jgi:hypothetical protein
MDYYSRYIKYKKKYKNLKGGAPKYRLYLTLDNNSTPGVPWGGQHITILGSHPSNTYEKLQSIAANFNEGVDRWTLKKGITNKSNLRKNKSSTYLAFDSDLLNRFSQVLHDNGFMNIKGPRFSGEPWHISVTKEKADSTMEFFLSNFRFWHLTICIENNDGTFIWEKVRERRIGFDFDGVIHTEVNSDPNSRRPLNHKKRNNTCFQQIINIIRKQAYLGFIIYIITARSEKSHDIIRDNLRFCGIEDWMIRDENIHKTASKISKADLAMRLGLEEFYDDSQENIIDFQSKQHIIRSPFELFKTFPENGTMQSIFRK